MSTGAITSTLAGLKAALSPLGKVFEVLPERFTPPAVLLKPADPLITTDGRPAGIGALHYEVVLMPRPGANPNQERVALGMAEDALEALRDHPHAVAETVKAPYDLALPTGTFLAISVTVTLPTRLTTD